MLRILLIGIGPGDPDLLTVQAIKALNRADVIFIPDKGAEKAELRRLRLDICARFIERPDVRLVDVAIPPRDKVAGGYRATVEEWHAAIGAAYETLFAHHLSNDACGAFLVWGDPTLYDSTLRILDALNARGVNLNVEIIPGITSVQVLASRHRIPLNNIGEPVHLTTGRKLAASAERETVVVLLDGEQAFTRLDGEHLDIFWGAYLGTPHEILVSGRLADVRDEITAVRAQARRDHGWIMDTYLLRQRDRDPGK